MQTGMFHRGHISVYEYIYIYIYKVVAESFCIDSAGLCTLCNIYIYIQMYHLTLQFNIFDNLTVFSTCVNVVL